MIIRALLIPAALACVLGTTSSLSGQVHPETSSSGRSATGLILGLNLSRSSVAVDDATFGASDRESARGMYFTLGYNFTPNIGLLVHAGGVAMSDNEDRTFGQADLALRYSFTNPAAALVPYLEIAVGGSSLQDELDGQGFELEGGGFTVAVGINYFVSRRFALNADFRHNLGRFNTIKIAGESVSDDARIGINASRLNLGFNWYPMGGR